MKGTAIMIPRSLRDNILQKIHDGHQGIQTSLLKARNCVHWVGLQKDIIDMIQRCVYCAEHSRSQQKEPLQAHEISGRPWEKIAADLFELEGQQFLVLADYYSKMPFVKSMNIITSRSCIDYMKSILQSMGFQTS
ncbi:pro-pol polyprotein [Plakobranchus ocellatus]|uniref:Pro-pol polyprotein n=1 Tax=Plakobranchus ocellatus TaxID=259542 RepID=A0AAV4AFU9_9GAST|nr:pro-pol polyprotein [Plakobranchus ocellatus]